MGPMTLEQFLSTFLKVDIHSLLKEDISNILKKDSYEIYIWLLFLADKIECKQCILREKKKHNRIPDCYKNCIPSKNLINSIWKKGDNNHD